MGKKEKKYIPPIFDEFYQGLVEIDGTVMRTRLLVFKDRIDFGYNDGFNRWATCIRFSTKIPKNEKQWNKKLDRVREYVERGKYASCDGADDPIWV